jgi:hypothetical protein
MVFWNFFVLFLYDFFSYADCFFATSKKLMARVFVADKNHAVRD